MGTRSDIIVHRADGKWSRIYCHWDGYPEGVGKTLFDNYANPAKAERLVALGDISSLGAKVTRPKGHSFDTPKEGYTVAYGRDRGEKDTNATVGDTLEDVWPQPSTWTEFTYVFDAMNGTTEPQWYIGDPAEGPKGLKLLSSVLKGEERVQSDIKAFGIPVGKHA